VYVSGTTSLTNTTFTTDASVNWDNASTGDNLVLQWDNWGATDYAVWDNKGPQAIIGERTVTWTRWYQTLTLPTYSGSITSASITGSYLLSDNTEAENISLYVYLERPGGDNITILELENTSSLWIADNSSFTSVDNTVTSYINAAGTYTLFMQDNIDRVALADGGSDNYVGIVWTAANLTITAETTPNPDYDADALAAYNNVVTLSWAGIGLMAVAIIIIAASVILGVVRGFGGAKL